MISDLIDFLFHYLKFSLFVNPFALYLYFQYKIKAQQLMRLQSRTFTENNSSIRTSNLGFLRVPQNGSRMTGHNLSNILTDQIFLRGLKNSYIGKISGVHKEIKEIEYEDLLPSILQGVQSPQNQKKNRINFSSVRNVQTQYKISPDSPTNKLFQKQHKGNQVCNKQILNLKSFINREKVQLFAVTVSCGFCTQSFNSNKVKLVLLNQSTLQLYGQTKQVVSINEDYNKLIFSLNFDTVYADVHVSDISNSNQLIITVGQFRLLLEHQSPEVVKQWFEKIETMRLQSKGKEFNLRKVMQIKQFYLRKFQTQSFFVKNCQTGDIILFQDSHFFAKVQRFVTRSSFGTEQSYQDHVAMVIRDINYGILLFQSNSGSGVSLTPWRSLLRYGWYQHIPRIVWRKLEIERNSAFNNGVEKFVKQNLQTSYHISFQKLLSAHSYVRPAITDNKAASKNEQHGYFCSELIATLYKQIGILTRETSNKNYQPACKFYPKDFSQKSNRKLDNGSLSVQYDLFFDKNVLKQRYKYIISD